MRRMVKSVTLKAARALGAFGVIANSRWRRRRLLILCYHGLSLRDEHEWHPLYVSAAHFRKRMELLARRGYLVLPLDSAVKMLYQGALPPKSVVITFDDGFHDFFEHGLPVLREFGFPATVYQTTYYSDLPYPIFNLALRYVFWRGRARKLNGAPFGVSGIFELSREDERTRALDAFLAHAKERSLSEDRKHQLASGIAHELGVDYAEIVRLGMLRLMNRDELVEITAAGIDIQLHTHRHRTPMDEKLFVRELRDNRERLAAITGKQAIHFCYPSGVYHPDFLPWLRAENVATATTCETGVISPDCEPLLMPRMLDSMNVTTDDFEGWLTGAFGLISRRRRI